MFESGVCFLRLLHGYPFLNYPNYWCRLGAAWAEFSGTVAPTHLLCVLTVWRSAPVSLHLATELTDLAGVFTWCFLSQSSDHPGVSRPNERWASSKLVWCVHRRRSLFHSSTLIHGMWRQIAATFGPVSVESLLQVIDWDEKQHIGEGGSCCPALLYRWRAHCGTGSLGLHAGA